MKNINEKKQKMKILHKTAKRKKDDDKSMQGFWNIYPIMITRTLRLKGH